MGRLTSENRPQRGQFLPDLQTHSPAMGQNEVSVKTNLYSSYVATKKGCAREVRRSQKMDCCGRFAADDSQVRQAHREAQINSSWRAITWLGRSAALLFLQISRYLLQKAPCSPSQSKRRASTRINLRFPRQQCGAAQRLSALQSNRLAVRSAVRSIRPLLFAVG